jgi:urocanate hydratase
MDPVGAPRGAALSDPAMGVVRQVDAGCPEAKHDARERGIKVP